MQMRIGRRVMMTALLGVISELLAPGCAVNLTDRTSGLVFDPPANAQAFEADVEAQGFAEINRVLLSVSGRLSLPMTRGTGNRWSLSVPIPACEGAVEYDYTVQFGPVLNNESNFPELGVFRAPVSDQPDSCDVLPPTVVSKTFEVNTTEDLADADPGDGTCDTALVDGVETCSLRAAVMEANAFAGADLIQVPVGRYRLTLMKPSGVEDDDIPEDAYGDLDITDAVTIRGLAVDTTQMGDFLKTAPEDDLLKDDPDKDDRFSKVDGNQIDRVFQVFPVSGEGGFVSLENLLIVNGFTEDRPGGGLQNRGTLALRRVVVSENRQRQGPGGPGGTFSANRGAGIANTGTLAMLESAAVRNVIEDTTGIAGGLYNHHGAEARIERSLFAFNRARFGSAIYNLYDPELGAIRSQLILDNTTLARNDVSGSVPGVIINQGTAHLVYVTLADNPASLSGLRTTGPLSIQNSILAQNGGNDCSGAVDSYGGNIIENAGCALRTRIGTDLTGVSPGPLGNLAHDGGFTFVYTLAVGGRAVDIIDAGSTLRCVGTDQRGTTRPIDGDGDGDADCDAGAYELEP